MNTIKPGTSTVALLVTAFCLSACVALPDTTLGHKCGIPDGVGCLSTQEVYDRAQVRDLPGFNRVNGGYTAPPRNDYTGAPILVDDGPKIVRTSALYAPPEELRIWVNRWRDSEGDLHDESFLYVLIGEGQWLLRD